MTGIDDLAKAINDASPEQEARDHQYHAMLRRLMARPLDDYSKAIDAERLRLTPIPMVLNAAAEMALVCIMAPVSMLSGPQRLKAAQGILAAIAQHTALALQDMEEREAEEEQIRRAAEKGSILHFTRN